MAIPGGVCVRLVLKVEESCEPLRPFLKSRDITVDLESDSSGQTLWSHQDMEGLDGATCPPGEGLSGVTHGLGGLASWHSALSVLFSLNYAVMAQGTHAGRPRSVKSLACTGTRHGLWHVSRLISSSDGFCFQIPRPKAGPRVTLP